MVLGDASDGTAGAFLVLASDTRKWWLKPLNNNQHPRATINEFLVGKLATLIGAPTCEVSLVYVPPTLRKLRAETLIDSNVSSGSLDVGQAQNLRFLTHRDRDHNSVRHVGALALYDWCSGGDHQWLYSGERDMQLYSHDHGHYLTNLDWTQSTLRAGVQDQVRPPFECGDLCSTEVDRLATRLGSISRQELIGVLQQVPPSWPVSDAELETLGWFLEERARGAADRLRTLS
jgi:hypothetical protein